MVPSASVIKRFHCINVHVEGGGGGGFKSIENVDPRYETRAAWAAVHYDMKHKKKQA